MSKASEAIFDNNCAGTNRHNNTHSIPGWNEDVDELYTIARQSFVEWIVDGKPKHVFDDMKRSRARFKYELRCLKRHKNQQIKLAILSLINYRVVDRNVSGRKLIG